MLDTIYRLVDGRTECKMAGGVCEPPIKDVMHPSGPPVLPPTARMKFRSRKSAGVGTETRMRLHNRRGAPGHRDSGHPASRRGRRRRRRQ